MLKFCKRIGNHMYIKLIVKYGHKPYCVLGVGELVFYCFFFRLTNCVEINREGDGTLAPNCTNFALQHHNICDCWA